MTDFAISIINFRTGKLTCSAAASVLDDLGDREARVVIVDNASGDGSADEIDAWIKELSDPRVELVRSPENGGFSAGHNIGRAATPRATAWLILNSDALIRPGFFDAMERALSENPHAGFLTPRLEWDDGEVQQSHFRFHTALSELDRAARTGPISRLLHRHIVALPLPPDPAAVEWASFACILVRGEMADALGPMDEGYFLYFEDAEYALRARRAGWKIAHVPEARAVHFRGGSGPVKELTAKRKRLPAYYWYARTRFLRQAHGSFGPTIANLGWIAGRGIARARALLGREVPAMSENEWRDIWLGWRAPLAPIRRES